MKKILVLLMLIISLFSLVVSAGETDCLYYFYGEDCPTCPEVNTFISDLENKYPGITVNKQEIYYDLDNKAKLEEFFIAYNIPKTSQNVPAIFMQNSYFVGVKSIKDLLESRILSNNKEGCPSTEPQAVVGLLGGEKSPKEVLNTLSVGRITAGGILDIFAIGTLTMLLILLAFTIGITNYREVLSKGLVFFLIMITIYFLFGRGYFAGLLNEKLDYWFSKVIAGLAVFFGLLLITRFFGGLKNTFKKIHENEEKAKLQMKLLRWSVSWPVVIIVSFLASLLTFSNFSATFMLLRKLSLTEENVAGALPYLLYHLFWIALPFIAAIIMITLAKKKTSSKYINKESYSDLMKESLTRQHFRSLNTIIGIAMLLLGILVLVM